jgi:hypothetical protein
VKFAFRLVGLMDDFEMNGAADVLRFRALAPGDYRLEVVAMDGTGQQSTTPLQLQFSIAEPWYASWMFYLVMALVLVGVVSGVFLLRIRYINQRNSRLLERSQLMQGPSGIASHRLAGADESAFHVQRAQFHPRAVHHRQHREGQCGDEPFFGTDARHIGSER